MTSTSATQTGELTCSGMVTIVGTPGNDTIHGTDGDDVIDGLEGNDTIYGFKGYATVCGGEGQDVLIDEIEETPRPGLALGGAGDDIVTHFTNVRGGSGNDEIAAQPHIPATFDGGPGDDSITGSRADPEYWGDNDKIAGGPGDDGIDVSRSLAHVDPGPGSDHLRFPATRSTGGRLHFLHSDGVALDLAEGTIRGDGIDTIVGIVTGVTGSPGNDTLMGSERREGFRGKGGNDTLMGRGGNDTLVGDRGDDSSDGGRGRDSCYTEQKDRCEFD